MSNNRFTHKILALSIALVSSQVSAQLEEVVVTATKRAESLQDIPVAVSAFTADSLSAKGISNVSQIGDFAPNVTLDSTAPISGSSSVLVAFIRGIGQSDYAMNYEPGVGLYVDGVYYARNVGSMIDMLDIERIEVLKGPQGTLFGRNTIAGAINVVTRNPGDELAGQLEVTMGSYNRQDIRGSINIPLTDSVAASLAFSSKNRDGFVKRIPYSGLALEDVSNFRSIDQGVMDGLPNGNDLGNENGDSIRGKISWQEDEFSLILSADYTRSRENSAPSTLVDAELWKQSGGIAGLYNACVAGVGPAPCNSITDGRTGNTIDPQFTQRTPYDNRFLTGDRETTYGNAISGTALDSYGVSLTAEWDISDSVTLKSITAYRNLDALFAEDADMSPLVIDHHAFELIQEQYSQELQLTGTTDNMKWILGAYYFNEEGENNDYVPLAGGLFQVDGPNEIINTSYALLGRVSYDITDDFSLTGGIRWTREDKEFEGKQRDLNGLSAQLGVPAAAFPDPTDLNRLYPLGKQEQDFNNVSITLSADYHIDDDIFAYASYSQGFKGGGWDTRLTGPELLAPDFSEEEAETYELGLKSQFLDNSLRLNMALFYTQYENLQLIIQRGISPLTANAGESEITGFEAELVYFPVDELEVSANYGWTDAEYTKLDDRAKQVGINVDNKFNNTPEHSLNLAMDYRQDLSSGGDVRWHLDVSWKDDTYNDAVNTESLKQDAMALVNASINFNSPDERWYVGLGIQNLTDKDYIVSGFHQPGVGFTYQTLGRPREAYVNVGMHF